MSIPSSWSEPALSVFKSFFPCPPNQGPVGRPPVEYLNILRAQRSSPSGSRPVEVLYPFATQACDRSQVAQICRDVNVDELEAYAVAMAWGGQRRNWFVASIASPALVDLLTTLRASEEVRDRDFRDAALTCKNVPGLGISYLTKALHFFRPSGNAYILDQWTAKSMCALRSGVVRMRGDLPAPDTSTDEYVMYCEMCEGLTRELRGWTPAQIEQALFDWKSGKWRAWVKKGFASGQEIESGGPSNEGGSTGGFGGQEPPKGPDDPDRELEDIWGDMVEEIMTAHHAAIEVGMPLPPGILKAAKSQVWLGGRGTGASDVKWYYQLRKDHREIEIGALFANKAIHLRETLIDANPDGRWFGSARADVTHKKICLRIPSGRSGCNVDELAETVVSSMSLLYAFVKCVATTRGISHPML